MTRTEIINTFAEKRGFKKYLEIGVFRGVNFDNVKCSEKTGVDPSRASKATVHEPSDYFFRHAIPDGLKYELVFIDGLHQFDQVYRDITNTLQCLLPGGVVVLHDCLPWTEHVATHRPHGGRWCGDVYKAVARYFSESPYLCYTVNEDCGCGVIDTSTAAVCTPVFPVDDMEQLDYAIFDKERDRLMNVVSGEQFRHLAAPSPEILASLAEACAVK